MHFYQNSKVRGKILFLMIGMSILFIIPNIVTLALVGSSGDVASLLHVLVPVDIVYLALLLVFYALAAVRFSKRVTRSTTEIVRAAEDLAEGKTRIHIDYAGNDELGAAAESMNHLSERISGAIQEVIRILSSIEKGNFNVETQYHWTGDWAQLNTTLKGITDSLNRIFSKINDASDQTASGSEQVASAAQALAQGATEQASSIQELSATIMEVSEHVKKNASNATDADRASVTAKEKINQADQNMREMMQAMTQISESSKKIGNIIKTIDDIAFQTNILALNAAVEAARAGSAGKGFAVVADEVRNLASKSAEAAKNTTALIEDSIKAVTNGSKIAGVTEQTLVEVQTAAGESNRLVNEIAKASNQQATSIGQITQGVQQISAVVQTNSATAEQSAAASEELAAQAKLLKRTISGIQLKESHNAASVKKAPDAKKEERVSAEAKPQKAEAASKMKPNDKYI